jgi:pyrroloquinoline quinone biosynthesis protein B
VIRETPSVLVVGTAQDGGYPQIGCPAVCCERVRRNPENRRLPASLALIMEDSFYMIDCTPSLGEQLSLIEKATGFTMDDCAGIFLTHSHYGHYIGLPLLGLEVMHRQGIPVYVMPQMESFLRNNAPFSQLISLGNIQLLSLSENIPVPLGAISITPLPVQHRNEFSETVGFSIKGKEKSILYIPDIDSWEGIDICQLIKEHEVALLDGTFYDRKELKNRKISKIPHPTIRESMDKFAALNSGEKRKIHFTHLNHTNPLLDANSEAYNHFSSSGFNLTVDGLLIHI